MPRICLNLSKARSMAMLFVLTPLLATSAQQSIPLAPGQHVRVALHTNDSARVRVIEGDVMVVDTSGFTMSTGDSVTRVERAAIAQVERRAPRSRLKGVLAGWLAAVPIAYVACRDEKYECGQGSLIGLTAMLTGALIGWTEWERLPSP